MVATTETFIRVADLAELQQTNCLTVQANGHTLVLFDYGDKIYAVDNRCPHMGFPLDRGTVKDGILTWAPRLNKEGRRSIHTDG